MGLGRQPSSDSGERKSIGFLVWPRKKKVARNGVEKNYEGGGGGMVLKKKNRQRGKIQTSGEGKKNRRELLKQRERLSGGTGETAREKT